MIWQFLISSLYFSVYRIFSQTADRNGQSTARYFLPSAPECCLTAQACAASLSFACLSSSHPHAVCFSWSQYRSRMCPSTSVCVLECAGVRKDCSVLSADHAASFLSSHLVLASTMEELFPVECLFFCCCCVGVFLFVCFFLQEG